MHAGIVGDGSKPHADGESDHLADCVTPPHQSDHLAGCAAHAQPNYLADLAQVAQTYP